VKRQGMITQNEKPDRRLWRRSGLRKVLTSFVRNRLSRGLSLLQYIEQVIWFRFGTSSHRQIETRRPSLEAASDADGTNV